MVSIILNNERSIRLKRKEERKSRDARNGPPMELTSDYD